MSSAASKQQQKEGEKEFSVPTQYWAVYMTLFGMKKKGGGHVACQRVFQVSGQSKTDIISKPTRMELLCKATLMAQQQRNDVDWKGHHKIGPIITLGTLTEPAEACQICVDYEVSTPSGPISDFCIISASSKHQLLDEAFTEAFKRLSGLSHPGQLCLITSIVIV